MAFSPDLTQLAYVRAVPGVLFASYERASIEVIQIPSGKKVRSVMLPVASPGSVAWAPDMKRILSVSRATHQASVVDLASGKVSPIGTLRLEGDLVWKEPMTVYSIPPVRSAQYREGYLLSCSRLDLETLSITPLFPDVGRMSRASIDSGIRVVAKIRESPHDHPYVQLGFGLTSRNELSYPYVTISVANRDGSYERLLQDYPGEDRDSIVFSRDARYAVLSQWSPYRSGRLRVIFMGRRPRPPLAVFGTVKPLQETAKPAEIAAIMDHLRKGDTIFALMLHPRHNPLNQRLIGGEGWTKAVVRLISFDGTALRARVIQEVTPPTKGDVLLHFQSQIPGMLPFESVVVVVDELRNTPDSDIQLEPQVVAEHRDRPDAPPAPAVSAAQERSPVATREQALRAYKEGRQTEAATGLRVAADQGDIYAMLWLASMHLAGTGVAKDPSEARRWFERAGNAGSPEAYFYLGALAAQGALGSVDTLRATAWYARAIPGLRSKAEQGDSVSQWALGQCLAAGLGGIRPDTAEALSWYRKSADQSYVPAMRSLGLLLLNSNDGRPGRAAALPWLVKAARQGDGMAQESLRRLHESW
jgi:hypothetical protein